MLLIGLSFGLGFLRKLIHAGRKPNSQPSRATDRNRLSFATPRGNCTQIITPGNRKATGNDIWQSHPLAPVGDPYIVEPALYIAPDTPDNGGTPHFPTAIKGGVNNSGVWTNAQPLLIPGMDPPPPGTVDHSEASRCQRVDVSGVGWVLSSEYCKAEFTWDVSSLGLKPGTYLAEFVIHDGDTDRGVGCIDITITP
jgi:hypothetical protein